MTCTPSRRVAWLLLTAAGLAACGDSTAPPTTGTLEINVVTTGEDLDPDGFLLTIGGGPERAIPANGTSRSTLGPGSHVLAVGGLALNCDVTQAPTSVDVTVGTTTRVEVRASCTTFLKNVIVYTSEEFGFPEVMAMRPDGSRRTRLTTDQAVYASPVVSPDGRSIAVASRVGGAWNGIYLLDRFGKGRTKLVGLSDFDASPSWSPDGTRLAFISKFSSPLGTYWRVFVINRDGSGLRQLTTGSENDGSDGSSAWSPDGTRLVFPRNGVLSVINADGTGLTSLGVEAQYPAWSPDGTQIAYHTWANNVLALHVVRSDGTDERLLTAAVEGDQMARWSPDSRQLVFQRVENQSFRLYRIAADGSGLTKLSPGPHSEGWPSWTLVF